jgi:acid stress chaperone HdeB
MRDGILYLPLADAVRRAYVLRWRIAMAFGLLLVVPPIHAQTTIDVTKITCKQFILLRVADPDKIALWLSGYHHAKRGSTTIDVQLLKEQPENIKRYCLYKDKDATVMEAVEKLLSSGN